MSRVVQQRIQEGACALAHRNALEALAALARDSSRRLASIHVVRGLANGVAQYPEFQRLKGGVSVLPPVAVAHLMVSSGRFARGIVEAMNADQEHWTNVFLSAFDAADEVAKRGIRQQTLTVVAGSALDQTAARVLEDATGEELTQLAVEVVVRREPVSNTLNRTLWEAARGTGDEVTVREAVMNSSVGAPAEQFVLQTLTLSRTDIEWLVARKGDEHRTSRLLRALLGTVSDEQIKALPRSTIEDVVTLLGTDFVAGRDEIARILVLDVTRDAKALDLGFRTLSALAIGDARNQLGGWVLCTGMSNARREDKRVSAVLAEFGPALVGSDLVEIATPSVASGSRIGANLVALDVAPPNVRDKVLGEVELLSEKLVGRPLEDLGCNGYAAWASMIRGSVDKTHLEVQKSVARLVLRFALHLVSRAVSGLIIETFPIAYESLPKSRKNRRRNHLESFLSSNYVWRIRLGEWDDSRKRAIDHLVRAFMTSNWPPADLVVAALRAGVRKKGDSAGSEAAKRHTLHRRDEAGCETDPKRHT